LKKTKTKFETILELFRQVLKLDDWENSIKNWDKALKKNGWTEKEFEEEIRNRIYGKGKDEKKS